MIRNLIEYIKRDYLRWREGYEIKLWKKDTFLNNIF